MKNPFKSIAAALDKAISGGEVDVIMMEEKPLDAVATGGLVAGAADAAGEAANDNEDSSDENALENAGDSAADGGEASGEADENAAADGGEAENAAGDEQIDAANAGGEPQSVAAVQQMLGEGQVAIGAVELEGLRADAAKWKENATELENLRAWKVAGSKENVLQGAVDAADAVTAKVKKVSAQTQAAIDLQEKMEAQRNK